MIVEEAVPADAAALLHLQRAVLAEERWFVYTAAEQPDDLVARASRVADYARSDNSAWFVAREGRSLVGYLTLTGGALVRTRHVARLEVLVAPPCRGRGVGRALIAHALAWASQNPMLEKVSLNVFEDNERARALYVAYGFVEEGRRPGEFRDADGTLRGDVLMALRLRGPG